MKKNFLLFFMTACIASSTVAQNVAINSTGTVADASSMLDISSSNLGLLIPRVALTAINSAAPVSSPATSLLVYNTATAGAAPNNVIPGYYYWDGSNWNRVATGNGAGWLTTGNAGTSAATNFIGTTDAVDWIIKTSNAERMRVTSAGKVGIGTSAPSYLLQANGDIYANGGWFRVSGNQGLYWESWGPGWYASDGTWLRTYPNGGSTGIWANNGQIGTNGGFTCGYGGTSAPVGGAIISSWTGIGTSTPSTMFHVTSGINAAGIYFVPTNASIYTANTSGAGSTLVAINTAGAGGGDGDAIEALTAQSVGFATWGVNTNNTSPRVTGGTGVVGSGANQGSGYLASGTGGAFTSFSYGLYARNIDFAFTQQAAIATYDGGNNQMLINAWSAGGTHYKVWASGAWTVSCAVPDLNNKLVTLHCPETPEFYFQDYGQGQLVNGRAHIELDPILAKNVVINEKHPLRAFVQLEGNCNGVYITNKTATGFDVIELNGGTSNVSFQWSVTCNVADHEENGKTNHTQDLRFEPGPVQLQTGMKLARH
jgi:hypothetical protein